MPYSSLYPGFIQPQANFDGELDSILVQHAPRVVRRHVPSPRAAHIRSVGHPLRGPLLRPDNPVAFAPRLAHGRHEEVAQARTGDAAAVVGVDEPSRLLGGAIDGLGWPQR